MIPEEEYPIEFQEDLIAIDHYRNPRYQPLIPDRRAERAIIRQQQAQLWATVGVSISVFVLLLACLP